LEVLAHSQSKKLDFSANIKPICDEASFKLVKVLSSSRFPIILVEKGSYPQLFVLKLFPLCEGNLTRAFLQEASVMELIHPNVIKLHQALPRFSFADNDSDESSCSAILMEHAANGDLCRLLKTASNHLTEAGVRTLFHQLLSGLEHLHTQGFAHLDIKPDNIFFDNTFTLKIGDFDQATMMQDGYTHSRGTAGYRAPEVKGQKCCNLSAADIFSAGVVLFVMKSRVPPYIEGKLSNVDLYEELTKEDNCNFWNIHCKAQKNDMFFDNSFKDLFVKMIDPIPENRPSIWDIKQSFWYNGPILSQEDLRKELIYL